MESSVHFNCQIYIKDLFFIRKVNYVSLALTSYVVEFDTQQTEQFNEKSE